MDAGQAYLLLVEDDPDILILLQTTLMFNGYRVLTARNGYEGLEAIEKERPQIVIADIMMPKLDGFGLVNRMRIHPETRDIPVVIITATYIAPEDREFAQNIGATRFIQKPINLEDFLETVRQLVEEGAPVAPEPLKGFDFYDGYRKRLEAKLEQKTSQIARDELLLRNSLTSDDRTEIQASLVRTRHERDELNILLDQIREQIQKY